MVLKKRISILLPCLALLCVALITETAHAQRPVESEVFGLSVVDVISSGPDNIILEGDSYVVNLCVRRAPDEPLDYRVEFMVESAVLDSFVIRISEHRCAAGSSTAPEYPAYSGISVNARLRIRFLDPVQPLPQNPGARVPNFVFLKLVNPPTPTPVPTATYTPVPTPTSIPTSVPSTPTPAPAATATSVPRPTATPYVIRVPGPAVTSTPTAYELVLRGVKDRLVGLDNERESNEWQSLAFEDDGAIIIRVHSPAQFNYCEHAVERLKAYEAVGLSLLFSEYVAFRDMMAVCRHQPVLVLVPEEGYVPPAYIGGIIYRTEEAQTALDAMSSSPTPIPGTYGRLRNVVEVPQSLPGPEQQSDEQPLAPTRVDDVPTPQPGQDPYWRGATATAVASESAQIGIGDFSESLDSLMGNQAGKTFMQRVEENILYVFIGFGILAVLVVALVVWLIFKLRKANDPQVEE